jgi:hypothetical protein
MGAAYDGAVSVQKTSPLVEEGAGFHVPGMGGRRAFGKCTLYLKLMILSVKNSIFQWKYGEIGRAAIGAPTTADDMLPVLSDDAVGEGVNLVHQLSIGG